MTTEDWRPIPGFTGSYQIHRDGRVRWVERGIGRGSLRHYMPGRIASTRTAKDGRETVMVCKGSRHVRCDVQELVNAAFADRAEGTEEQSC